MKRRNNTFMSNVPDFRKIAPLFEGFQALLGCPSGTSNVEMKMSTMVEWYWRGKIEALGEKSVLLPLRPPQIPHGVTLD
jgi:hypothetical protein